MEKWFRNSQCEKRKMARRRPPRNGTYFLRVSALGSCTGRSNSSRKVHSQVLGPIRSHHGLGELSEMRRPRRALVLTRPIVAAHMELARPLPLGRHPALCHDCTCTVALPRALGVVIHVENGMAGVSNAGLIDLKDHLPASR